MHLSDQLRIARQLIFLQVSQWWSAKKIAHYQAKSLIRIMRFAVLNVPFYRSLGLNADSINSPQDLSRFPVITKAMIQENGDGFLADGLEKAKQFSSRTSGSTGEPTVTFFDRNCWLFSKYALKLRRMLAMVNPLFKRILIISEQESQGDSLVFGTGPRTLIDGRAYLCIHQEIRDQIPIILDYRPDLMYAFPSYLLELLHTFQEEGIAVPKIPIICTSSEVLTGESREKIEKGFRGQVFDIYGSTEFKEIAWQCAQGVYHLNFESVYVEPTKRHENSNDNDQSLLVSSLLNYAMPLLRFDLGDVAEVENGGCPCGRQSPHLSSIDGRQASYIELPSGRRCSPYSLTTAIEISPGIRKYQIVQTSRSSLRIDLVIAKDAEFEPELRSLGARLTEVLSEPIKLNFNEVKEIPRSTGGKFHVVRKEIT